MLLAVLAVLLPAASFAVPPTAHSFSAYARQYEAPEFFSSNGAAFDARLKLLDQAPAGARALIATFAFENGQAVRRLAGHLCAAAKRGVRVELLVDGHSAGRPGLDDTHDKSDDAQAAEELLQYVANCGARVYVHNLNTSYVEVLGMRLPNIFLDPRFEGRRLGLFHLPMVLRHLRFLLKRAGALVSEELHRAGIHADPLPLLRSFRSLLVRFARGSGGPLPPSGRSMARYYEALLLDPVWDHLSAAKVKAILPRIEARFHADSVFGPLRDTIRRYNRINHRKLFLVDGGADACMVLGGRNLGDHYLTDGAGAFHDGDLLLCRHQGESQAGALAGAQESFRELLSDRLDPYFGRGRADSALHEIRANAAFRFRRLALLPPKRWADSRAPRGELALHGASGFHLLRSGWDPSRDEVRAELLRRIGAERSEIFLETPYAELDAGVRAALEAALARGVRVEVVTNSYFISDGLSGLIRVLMSHWNERMAKRHPELFRVRFVTLGGGRMTHFKFAAFHCQEGAARGYLLGSHNFHPRSGNADKEHMLTWDEAGGCEGRGASASLVRAREAYYAAYARRAGKPALAAYRNLFDELIRVRNSPEYRPRSKMAAAMLEMFYEERGGIWRPRLESRAARLLHLADESGLHDLLGRVL